MRRMVVSICFMGLMMGCPPDPPEPSEGWTDAFDASDLGWFLSTWGPSADDIYAVGGNLDDGLMMHHDGASWSEVAAIGDVPLLNWVHGLDADDIFVVGNGGTALHWDGALWTPMDTPTDEDLWGVWAAASDDVYAVGGRGLATAEATILHYDGMVWSAVEVPELMRPNVFAFFKVWGSAADDVWVVGQRGAVLHYDGTEWTEQLVGTSEDVISVWGVSSDRVAMAAGRNNGTMVTWNGSEFATYPLAPMPGLNGVWMRNADRVHLAGNEGQLAVVDFMTGEVISDDYQDTRLAFHAVFGDDSGRLFSVGGNFQQASGPFMGIAMQRDLEMDE